MYSSTFHGTDHHGNARTARRERQYPRRHHARRDLPIAGAAATDTPKVGAGGCLAKRSRRPVMKGVRFHT